MQESSSQLNENHLLVEDKRRQDDSSVPSSAALPPSPSSATSRQDQQAPASVLPKQTPRSHSPIIVETVESDEDDDDSSRNNDTGKSKNSLAHRSIHCLLLWIASMTLVGGWLVLLHSLKSNYGSLLLTISVLIISLTILGLSGMVLVLLRNDDERVQSVKRILVDEFQAFCRDWKEARQQLLLLEYNGDLNDAYQEWNDAENDIVGRADPENHPMEANSRKTKQTQNKKKKSVLFQVLVKPIFKLHPKHQKLGLRRRRKQKHSKNQDVELTSYVPPSATTTASATAENGGTMV